MNEKDYTQAVKPINALRNDPSDEACIQLCIAKMLKENP
jgi:hypothetical protein